MKYKNILIKDYLIQKYWVEHLSTYKIAKEVGCDRVTVFSYLKKHNIPRRTISEANKGKKLSEITKVKIGLSNLGKHLSIETREKMSLNHADFSGKNHPFYDKHHTKEVKEKISKAQREEKHWNYGKVHSKETKEKMSEACKGKNNPNWRGGKSFEPYSPEFNQQLKDKIRKRDNYTCQKCPITEEEHLIVYGRVLCVHHIDYDKMNCEEDNLITLCNECNLRVNYNRDYWKNYFKEINKSKILMKLRW